MRRRQLLPRLWLMTDERLGEALLEAIAGLPRGAGVVFRYHRTEPAERRALYEAVMRIARRNRLVLVLAGTQAQAKRWGADGSHGRSRGQYRGLRTASAHNLPEIRAAERSGAEAIFLSPVHPTRSHPGARSLGRLRFALLARQAKLPVIALGGMDAKRARALPHIHGWAGIDAWAPRSDQKRKAVPI